MRTAMNGRFMPILARLFDDVFDPSSDQQVHGEPCLGVALQDGLHVVLHAAVRTHHSGGAGEEDVEGPEHTSPKSYCELPLQVVILG